MLFCSLPVFKTLIASFYWNKTVDENMVIDLLLKNSFVDACQQYKQQTALQQSTIQQSTIQQSTLKAGRTGRV